MGRLARTSSSGPRSNRWSCQMMSILRKWKKTRSAEGAKGCFPASGRNSQSCLMNSFACWHMSEGLQEQRHLERAAQTKMLSRLTETGRVRLVTGSVRRSTLVFYLWSQRAVTSREGSGDTYCMYPTSPISTGRSSSLASSDSFSSSL